MTGVLLKVGGLHAIDRDLPSFRPSHLLGILAACRDRPGIAGWRPPRRQSGDGQPE